MSYSSEVLADSPLGYWRMGEASGTVMADASGNARDGVYENTPTLGVAGLLAGDTDTAVSFDKASSEGASLTYDTWMNASAFTIEAIIKPTTVTGTQVIASRQAPSGSGSKWTFRLDGGILRTYNWNSGGTLQGALSAPTPLVAGGEYHVAFEFVESGTRKIYVNGVEVASAAASTMGSSTQPIRIARSGPGEYFGGVIDEVAYYGTTLGPTRIAAHYTAATTAGATGTLSAVLPSLSANLSGGIEFSGTVTATLPSLTSALVGETYPPGIAGDIVAALPPLSADLSGTSTVPVYSGTLAATLPALRATLAGQSFQPGLEGYIEALLPALSASLFGDAQGRVGLGLILDSSATVSADAPLDPLPTPTGAPATTQRIVATSVPVPTLVAGRPQ